MRLIQASGMSWAKSTFSIMRWPTHKSASQWSMSRLALRMSPRHNPPCTFTSTSEKITPARPVRSLPRSDIRVFSANVNTAGSQAGDSEQAGARPSREGHLRGQAAGKSGDGAEIVALVVGHRPRSNFGLGEPRSEVRGPTFGAGEVDGGKIEATGDGGGMLHRRIRLERADLFEAHKALIKPRVLRVHGDHELIHAVAARMLRHEPRQLHENQQELVERHRFEGQARNLAHVKVLAAAIENLRRVDALHREAEFSVSDQRHRAGHARPFHRDEHVGRRQQVVRSDAQLEAIGLNELGFGVFAIHQLEGGNAVKMRSRNSAINVRTGFSFHPGSFDENRDNHCFTTFRLRRRSQMVTIQWLPNPNSFPGSDTNSCASTLAYFLRQAQIDFLRPSLAPVLTISDDSPVYCHRGKIEQEGAAGRHR